MRSLGDAMYKPGIVSALVTLYLADDSWDEASNVLKEAVDWYRKNKVRTFFCIIVSLLVGTRHNFYIFSYLNFVGYHISCAYASVSTD